MTNNNIKTAILLLSCRDQKGLVFKITNFIYKIGGNIIDLDEHVDTTDKKFFLRVAFEIDKLKNDELKLSENFEPIGKEFEANWSINFADKKINTAIFVSKHDHCLQEILWRYSQDEFKINIKFIISNHDDLRHLADQYKIPYYHLEMVSEKKDQIEAEQLKLLKDHKIKTIVLARYMQILTSNFVDQFSNQIINIHHSFLPAFIGGNPYKQAFQRGVKIIGATSHFVTSELDQGPIIEQDIIRISHSDTLKDLIRKGRDLERSVLARGILLHSQHRILVDGKKTIVFE